MRVGPEATDGWAQIRLSIVRNSDFEIRLSSVNGGRITLSRNSKYICDQIKRQNTKQSLSGSWVSFIIVFFYQSLL
jgi:hypothetical protein